MTKSILDALQEKVLLFDGAMGTEIQKCDLPATSYPDNKEGFNDGLTISSPDTIKRIHTSYSTADCIETNTFGSNKIKLDEYGFGHKTYQINKSAAEMARVSKYVIGVMGPTGQLPSTDGELGKMSLDEIEEAYDIQARGLHDGGADAIMIETGNDILEVKTAVLAAKKCGLPVFACVTFPLHGRMLLGTPVEAAYTTLRGLGIDAFGINCSTGPKEMIPAIEWLDRNADIPIIIIPNAGLPENKQGRAVYKMTPTELCDVMKRIISKYKCVRGIGGCCGVTPAHIKQLCCSITA